MIILEIIGWGTVSSLVLRRLYYWREARRLRKRSVNVRDFGAIGDGVHNDTAAFHAANEAAAKQGKTTYVPPGNYVIGGKVRRHR